MIISQIKNRLTILNGLRLVVGIAFLGEGWHSQSYIFAGIGLVFLIQLFLNKKCPDQGCSVEN